MDLIDWKGLWDTLFGTQELFGINMGFWIAMIVTALVVVVQNLIFWLAFKPFHGKYERGVPAEEEVD